MFRTSYSTMKFSHFVFNFNLSSRRVNNKDEKKNKTKEDKTIKQDICYFSFNNFETINNEVVLNNFSFFLISYLSLVTFFRFSFLSFSYRNKKIITKSCDRHQTLLFRVPHSTINSKKYVIAANVRRFL